MRIIPTLLVVFFCIAGARAQSSLPEAPAKTTDVPVPLAAGAPSANGRDTAVFHKNIFWPLVAACGTAGILDGKMSRDYLESHPTARETKSAWLVGERPSLTRYYLTIAALDSGAVIVSYKLLRSHRKALRITGWVVLGGLTYVHAYADISLASRTQ